MEDIFDLFVSKKEHEFVRNGLALELDVSADMAETFCEIPYIGSLIKLGKVGSKFQELHFVRKVAKFLEKEMDIPEKDPLMAAEYTDDNYININESSIL